MKKRTICLPRPRLMPHEQIERMYPAALKILSEIGMRVRHPEALAAAERAGIKVTGDRAFPDKAAVADLVVETGPKEGKDSCPAEVLSPEIQLTIHNYPAEVVDLNTNQLAPYTTEQLIENTKLVDTCASRGLQAGAPGVPADVPPYLRTVLQFRIGAQYSRTGRSYWDAQYLRSLPYVMDMAEAVGHPVRQLPVFVNSPLSLGGESLAAAIELRHRLDSVRVGNISAAGLSTPIMIGDALAVGLAEVLGGAAITRAATDLPVDWSIWVSGGSPAGLLEYWASDEVTSFYHGRKPSVPGGYVFTGARFPGAQAVAEKMCSLAYGAIFGCRSFLGAGNLAGDTVWSAEQLMIDLEIRDYVAHLISGVDPGFDQARCLTDVVEGVEEGIFLGLESTVKSYRQIDWFPKLFGGENLHERAKEMVREQLARYDYQLEPEVSRELDRIYARAEQDLKDL